MCTKVVWLADVCSPSGALDSRQMGCTRAQTTLKKRGVIKTAGLCFTVLEVG